MVSPRVYLEQVLDRLDRLSFMEAPVLARFWRSSAKALNFNITKVSGWMGGWVSE